MYPIFKISFFFFCCLYGLTSMAQVSGNINYNNQGLVYSSPQMGVSLQNNNFKDLRIKVRGLYNEKASQQNAVISLMQVGQNIDEVNDLMDGRIEKIRQAVLALSPDIQFFVDIISFVPMYEYDLEKKPFNKKTYNEIPSGFEVKKNLHIGYKNSNMIHQIMAICAQNEVYDLVRVDYISDNFEEMQDSLRRQAFDIYKQTLAHYEKILGQSLADKEKTVNDGFNVSYPQEKYQSYQAFSKAQLPSKKGAVLQQEQKNTTLHYMPELFKNHQFVIHPDLIEPAIQMIYELVVSIKLKEEPKPPTKQKEYFFVNPQGDLKKLDIR